MKDRLIYAGLVLFASVICSFGDVEIGNLIGGTGETNDDVDADPDNKISNGRVAPLKPFQIQLLSNGKFRCSGSILNNYWILTAAHCVKGASGFQIITGTKRYMDKTGGKLYNTDFATYHQDYDDKRLLNDIALIRTKESIQFSSNVQPVQLAEMSTTTPGKTATIAGWGATEGGRSSAVMLETSLKIISTQQCKKSWNNIDESHVCTAPTVRESMTCQGDSGGPLTLGNIQIGIVSYGTQGCPGIAGYPNVFTKVAYFKTWINKQIYSNPSSGESAPVSGGGYGSQGGGYGSQGSGYGNQGSRYGTQGGGYGNQGHGYGSRGGGYGSQSGKQSQGTGGKYIPGFGFFAEQPEDSNSYDEPEIEEGPQNLG